MSKGWHIDWPSDTLFYPNGKAVLCKMGYEESVELTAALNALQAVADAAKKLEAMAFKEPRQGHCSHQQHRVVQDDDFLKLRTALAGLEAAND